MATMINGAFTGPKDAPAIGSQAHNTVMGFVAAGLAWSYDWGHDGCLCQPLFSTTCTITHLMASMPFDAIPQSGGTGSYLNVVSRWRAWVLGWG